jgi:hypothetical protein
LDEAGGRLLTGPTFSLAILGSGLKARSMSENNGVRKGFQEQEVEKCMTQSGVFIYHLREILVCLFFGFCYSRLGIKCQFGLALMLVPRLV